MKVILFLIFIVSFSFSMGTNATANNDSNIAQTIFSKMGLTNREEISKKEFEELFFRILSKDQPLDENASFFTAISMELTKNVPDTIKTKEINKYLVKDKIINAVEDVVREMYGPQYVKGVKESFGKTFDNDIQFPNKTNNDNSSENKDTKINSDL